MNEVLLNRLYNLSGKKGILKVAHAGEVAFTFVEIHPPAQLPSDTDENAFQLAITESDFTVYFHEGDVLDGRDTMRVSGRHISAIHSEEPGRKNKMAHTAGAPTPRRVVVLGAGASYHARYPLAAAMGHCLAAWINTLPADSEHHWCLQEITRTYGALDDFETILADLVTCPAGSKADGLGTSRPYVLNGLKEAIRDHFATIRSAPTLLYDRLAALLQPGDAVITFNYDLGIERALSMASKWNVSTGYGFTIGRTPKASSVGVLKLHGSINWRALLFDGITSGMFAGTGNSLGKRPVLSFKPDLEYLGAPNFVDPLCAGLTTVCTLPALIMPALPKQFFFKTTYGQEWKAFWDYLWDGAEHLVQSADEVVIIGYSLPVLDERARSLLLNPANKNAKLYVYCRADTNGIEQLFRDQGFNNVIAGIAGTPMFEDFLDRAERSNATSTP
jgi:hypothetical protein